MFLVRVRFELLRFETPVILQPPITDPKKRGPGQESVESKTLPAQLKPEISSLISQTIATGDATRFRQHAIENALKNNKVYVRAVRVELPSSATSDGAIRPSLNLEILGPVKP